MAGPPCSHSRENGWHTCAHQQHCRAVSQVVIIGRWRNLSRSASTAMFREIEMSVAVGDQVIFRFAEPMSLISLVVSSADHDTVWQLFGGEFEPVETQGGSFRSWKIEEAPPEILAMFEEVKQRAEREFQERGPSKPGLREVTYGTTPEGYRAEVAAQALLPGEYSVIVFAEQGQAAASFLVAG